MHRETALAGGVALVLSGTVLAVALVPGILAQPVKEDLRPARLSVEETTVAAGAVGGETATLSIDTRLVHRGSPAENVTVLYRAVDLDTGLVATERTRDLGTVSAAGERSVPVNLSVERQGGYRLETVVFAAGERVARSRTDVKGVGSLPPAYADSPVGFQRFDRVDLPTVQYAVDSVAEDRATLRVSTYLTNGGDAPAGDLRLTVVARQADSHVVADRATVGVGQVRPGRTVTPEATLEVPVDYNYYLDAVLWKDGVIVDTARSAANLDPSETLSVNESRREVNLEVGDFASEGGGSGGPGGRKAGATRTAEGAGPGFGLAALLGTALLAGRWSA